MTVPESQARGALIVEAILAYQREHRRLPATLGSLVPSHLPAIDPPTAGTKRWRYVTDQTTGTFVLEFNANAKRYPRSWYEWTTGRWEIDQ